MNVDLCSYLEQTERYLNEKLIPFWRDRIEDAECGGFQPNYDRDGRRTDVGDKALLAQARVIFSVSHALRLGFEWPGAREMLKRGIDFAVANLKDPEYGGYCWIADREGRITDDRKVIYGHSFLIYGLSEHALLTGDERSAREAADLCDLLLKQTADVLYGGFYEHFTRDFRLDCVRPDGVFHKSLDVHMHLMEAMTKLYELTGDWRHRQLLEQLIELVFQRMTDREIGLGIAMFQPDWTPIRNVQLDALWGRDRFEGAGKAPEITSYGHNIELAWLYVHALEILGKPRDDGLPRVRTIYEHTYDHGVDWECGGLYVEGHRTEGPTEKNKEFWQQAEAMVGFLEAYRMTGDEKYLKAFANVHDFVFQHMINWAQGEWYPLLDRRGNVLADEMGYNWKIFYHTLRGVCQVIVRLREFV